MFYLAAYAAMIIGASAWSCSCPSRASRTPRFPPTPGWQAEPVPGGVADGVPVSLPASPDRRVHRQGGGVHRGRAVRRLAAGADRCGCFGHAAFFYIRVLVLMYMQEPPAEGTVLEIERAPVGSVAVAIPAVLTVLFGILPGLLFGFLSHASVIRF